MQRNPLNIGQTLLPLFFSSVIPSTVGTDWQIGAESEGEEERREEAVTFGGSLTVCEKERGSAHSSAVFLFPLEWSGVPIIDFAEGSNSFFF